MGYLTLFGTNQKKQTIKTLDDFEYKFTQGKNGNNKRKLTREELIDKYKAIGNDILGFNYAGGSFVSGLD